MTRIRGFVVVVLLLLSVSSLPLAAQEDTPNVAQPFDAVSLAERYEGYVPPPPLPELEPIYNIGDKMTFTVGQNGEDAPREITATLVARGAAIYMWVEDGITAANGNIRGLAGQMQSYFVSLQANPNYFDPVALPGFDPLPDTNGRIPIPDADNDPRLWVLYTTNLTDDRDGIYNPIDSTPSVILPRSNGHELITLNTTPYPDLTLDDGVYASAIARAIYRVVMSENNPTQSPWLADALNWRILFTAQDTGVTLETVYAFLATPETSLIRTAGLTNRVEVLGGMQVFLNYIAQRAGLTVVRDLYLTPGGINAVDAALAKNEAVDPLTSEPMTMRDLFADFVITNLIDLPFGDGRYVYPDVELDRQRLARAELISTLSAPVTFPNSTVLPFASRNFRYTARGAEVVEVVLESRENTPLLPMPADRDPSDAFYWSGQGAGRDAVMTRTLDLSGVESATLTFDAWHDLVDGWNHGYTSVSTDGGATWRALASNSTVENSRYGTTFGSAFSSISNPEGSRPFPILGAGIGGNGMSLQTLSPGGPAEQAGLLVNDAIIGYDGQPWQSTPNIIGLMSNYAPGDTINFLVQRGQARIEIPVVLGAHPTRVFTPPPLWQPQTVDLTPYAGQEILLRFEYVSLPMFEDHGFAVDNIAVPEIDFSDSGEGAVEGWTLAGWSSVDNLVPQQLIIQSITSGTQTEPPRVRRLVDADEVGTGGTWRFDLAAGETLYIAVSGVNDDTDQAATFDLTIQSAN